MTLVTPEGVRGPLPGWVVLHGITRPGRHHPALGRFIRALAASGCVVAVPEVPEWRELRLSPEVTPPTVRASLRALVEHADVAPGHLGIMGFSFGAPQALTVVTDPEVHELVGGVVGFGGYCDLVRTVHFQFTGEHELDGHVHRLSPDPYGRWVVGANYLTHVPGYGGAGDVADALNRLASLAGDLGIESWDPSLDVLATQLREDLSRDARPVFDLFAHPASTEPPRGAVDDMAEALAAAARRVDPAVDPTDLLGDVDRPVHLLHGRHDRLIPYSEGLRLGRALRSDVLVRSTVTSLFGHSARDRFPGPVAGTREAVRFVRALAGILSLL